MVNKEAPAWNNFVDGAFRTYGIFIVHSRPKAARVSDYHRQPGVELHFTHHGRGTLYINGKAYLQGGRHVLILHGDQPHQVYADLSSGYLRTALCLDNSVVSTLLSLSEREIFRKLLYAPEPLQVILPGNVWYDIDLLIDRLHDEYRRHEPGWQTYMLGGTIQLLVLLSRGITSSGAARMDHFVQQCIELVDANLDEDLSISQIALMLGLSPKHLSRTFSRAMGVGLTEYVLEQRLSLACRLLKERNSLSVSGIAMRCGFRSMSYFSQVFTRRLGKPPSVYRREIATS